MRVIISAGGTGGHIYPAIAIINKIKEKEPESQVLYIGTHNRMEKDIVPEYDINFISLKITGFKRSLSLSNFKTVWYFLKAIGRAKKIIKDFKPDVVIGVGGYVTGPVIYAAHKLGVKTFIHEQNSIPGLANKFLSKYVDKIGASFKSSLSSFPKEKVVLTGNPSGSEYLKKKKIRKKNYGLNDNKRLVLIVMGSLGSTSVNEKFKKIISEFKNKNYEVMYITGKNNYDSFIEKLNIPKNVIVTPYLKNMGGVLKTTDLIITRAGASIISEITAIGVPSIMIPSKYVVADHQKKNAEALEKKGVTVCLEEDEIEDKLVKEIDNLFEDDKRYKKMIRDAKKFGIKDSATIIYNELFDLIHRR